MRIGALTRHVELLESDLLAMRFPVFRDAERVIADPVVRNRGTIGGSLCQADAAEDLSAVCSALKAQVVIRGRDGERVVGLDDFYVGPFTTAVGDGEILTEVRLGLRPGAGSAHEKVERRAGDWAVAAASAALWIENGTIADAGVALSAVGPTTVHVQRAEELLRGKAPGGGAVRRGRRDRVGGLRAAPGRPRTRGLQAPPRGRLDETRPAPRRGPCAAPGGVTMQVTININGEQVSARRRAAAAARPLHPGHARPDRHPLGLRHLELRGVRRADGRACR